MIALPAAFVRSPWGLVVVSGPDATSFLQSIVSQDLAPVGVGQTVASLLLQPQGKLDVAFRATLRERGDDGDVWWLDCEPQMAERLVTGLSRFKIRVKAEIEDRSATCACGSIVGTRDVSVDDAVTEPAPTGASRGRAHASGPVRIDTVWGEHAGLDLVGDPGAVDRWLDAAGIRRGASDELEVLRIESGIPAQGVDVDDGTIPQEAFLERDAVSFTKGCFIGQELVCRIDARGHVNRFLRRLELPGGVVPPHGSDVHHGGKVVGVVTSAVADPGEDRVVALAMIRREVEPPATVTVHAAGAEVAATVH